MKEDLLVELDLSGEKIKDNQVEILMRLMEGKKNLKRVNLSNNQLTDLRLFDILRWFEKSEVEVLNLNGNKMNLEMFERECIENSLIKRK